MQKIIIGIDAAFRNFGIVFDNITHGDNSIFYHEIIKTEKVSKKSHVRVSVDDFENIQKIANRLQVLIDQHCEINDKMLIVAELPTGASQSSIAARLMGFSIAIIGTLSALYDIPVITIDPKDAKVNLIGSRNATKDQVMETICKRFQGSYLKMELKPFTNKKGKVIRSHKYHIRLGGKYYDKDFEHVADAINAVLLARTTNRYQMWDQ